jgi:DNA-binding transcriptional MerR regulator
MPPTPPLLTLAELVATVPKLLADGYQGVRSGRIRDLPDERTIRWYQSVGILDRPSGFRGRAALYGRRHLVQIAVVKRLQAAGFSLESIQGGLAGKTDGELARSLDLPLRDVDALIASAVAARESNAQAGLAAALEPSRRDSPFWKTRPTATPVEAPIDAPIAASAIPSESPAGLQSESVGSGMVVLWNGRPLTPIEQARLAELSAPLVAFLSSTAITPAERGAASRTRRPQKGPNP